GAVQNDKAATDYAQALALVRDDANASSKRAGILDEIVRSDDLLARVAKLRPKDSQLWLTGANHHAARRQWTKVATALAKAVELDPTDHFNWYQLAPVYLELGDNEGYRRVCREMLDRFAKADQPEVAERTAKTCLLVPEA